MEEQKKDPKAPSWIATLLVLALVIILYVLLHAWLVHGVDRPDPHPLQPLSSASSSSESTPRL